MPNQTYIDEDGHRVEVQSWSGLHVTEIAPGHWVYTDGPRRRPNILGQAPAIHDGCFFQGGGYKFKSHACPDGQARVVEDLGCEEGPQVWRDYAILPDGTQGPTIESVRSPRKLKEYMKLTGHRIKEK